MAYLINRNPPARLECLHNLCKFIDKNFGTKKAFKMKDIKFDNTKDNIHNYCGLLKENTLLGFKYCPYKKNPVGLAGCSLTNGVYEDSTKSKEVSNTINALDAIGFISRKKHKLYFSEEGKKFANTFYHDKIMVDIIRNAILSYGLFIGLLGQLFLMEEETFKTKDLCVGYPNSEEKITLDGETIIISSGSMNDSNTRTKSCLLAWGTTAGIFAPISLSKKIKSNIKFPQIEARSYLLSENRNQRNYEIINFPNQIFEGKFVTQKPLDYKNLTKNTGALRENNQQKIREETLRVEDKIQNRRYAIIFALNLAFNKRTTLNIDKLIEFLKNYSKDFIINESSFNDIIYSEMKISFMAGIPYKAVSNAEVFPLTGVNLNELNKGIPRRIAQIMQDFKL